MCTKNKEDFLPNLYEYFPWNTGERDACYYNLHTQLGGTSSPIYPKTTPFRSLVACFLGHVVPIGISSYVRIIHRFLEFQDQGPRIAFLQWSQASSCHAGCLQSACGCTPTSSLCHVFTETLHSKLSSCLAHPTALGWLEDLYVSTCWVTLLQFVRASQIFFSGGRTPLH